MSLRSPAEDEKGGISLHIAFSSTRHSRACGNPGSFCRIGLIGVGDGFRRPRPPNRACGSPAHGSPVGSFLIGIGSLTYGLH